MRHDRSGTSSPLSCAPSCGRPSWASASTLPARLAPARARGLSHDPAHVDTVGRLRRRFQHPDRPADSDDLARDLADYDRAFGLTGKAR